MGPGGIKEPIVTKFLKKDEVAEYARLQALPKIGGVLGVAIASAAAVVAVGIAGFALGRYFRADGYEVFANSISDPATWIAIVVVSVWGIGNVVTRLDKSRKLRDEAITNWRYRIEYDDRVRRAKIASMPRSEPADIDPRYTWMTGSYNPARYYSYDKSQRDYMRMTGIDADTYDANVEGRE